MDKFIDQCENFPFELIRWYQKNHRKLPWRETKDAYKIWLSEIILQQTRVAQGQAYYEKFTKKYPQIEDLASATEEEVLKDWQGLGYYSRARNLHYTAKMIVHEHGGKFPNDYSEIRKLKGIGEYTAAAIASFAFDKDYAVVDGNVYRLLSRYFGINSPIDSTKGKKEFAALAQELIPKDKAAIYNQAIMEFGAIQCSPVNPNCANCPLQSSCSAFEKGMIDQLPFKEKKVKVEDRHLHYLIIRNDDSILLNKRSSKGIWQNLFDFPSFELTKLISYQELKKQKSYQNLLDDTSVIFEGESESRKHLLSHRRLHCKFFHFRTENFSQKMQANYSLTPLSELGERPVPKLIENYLREETNLLSLFD